MTDTSFLFKFQYLRNQAKLFHLKPVIPPFVFFFFFRGKVFQSDSSLFQGNTLIYRPAVVSLSHRVYDMTLPVLRTCDIFSRFIVLWQVFFLGTVKVIYNWTLLYQLSTCLSDLIAVIQQLFFYGCLMLSDRDNAYALAGDSSKASNMIPRVVVYRHKIRIKQNVVNKTKIFVTNNAFCILLKLWECSNSKHDFRC